MLLYVTNVEACFQLDLINHYLRRKVKKLRAGRDVLPQMVIMFLWDTSLHSSVQPLASQTIEFCFVC